MKSCILNQRIKRHQNEFGCENVIFYKLSAHHKKWFIINQIAVFVALIIMFIIALNVQKLELPTNESKLSASFGFVIVGFVLVLALFNRINPNI